MKALRWYGRKDLRYDEIPEPFPGSGQIKVKINIAGICGTDLKEYVSGPMMIRPEKAPVVLGHEFVGKVVEAGQGVTEFKPGDRVTGVGYWYCGECFFCRKGQYNICLNWDFNGLTVDGCLAEYLVTPAYASYKLPDTVSDESGAIVEPLAVAIHAVRQGNVSAGDRVAVVGDGTIGLCAVMAARAVGASEVYLVSKHKGRGRIGEKLGASQVIYSDSGDQVGQVAGLTGGLGVDVSIECVGRPETPELAIDLVRRGGTTVLTGVFEEKSSFNFIKIMGDEKKVVGSPIYVHEGRTAVAWLKDGRVDPGPIITSIVPFEDALKLGFEKLLQDKEEEVKVLVKI
jgi:(R,R)-butanediol dehydrogenase/meso-butanediol dehydrogenase/diacetyl reductase